MEHIVKIDRVSKKYGDKQILKDISFTARSDLEDSLGLRSGDSGNCDF